MHRQLIILIVIIIWSTATLPFPKQAGAQTALTRAVVQSLRNLVQLMPQNKTARQARVSDGMTPGDALSTGRSSLAELRFNDGSLARIGEQAVFRFVQQTRNFNLSNGTVLMLIPPGQGRTDVRTPNASAAIRGSALFIRYIPETATTAIGALTNSNIEVYNQRASQSQVLQAGQLAVIVKDRIAGLYKFDLKTFYETSDLVQGLNLNKKSGLVSSDPAIALVQAETAAALAAQSPLTGAEVIVNPAFVRRPNNSQGLNQPITLQEDSQNPFNSNFSPVTEFLENGEIIVNPERFQNLPSNTEPLTGSPDGGFSSGSEQQNEGNNGIGNGIGGGGINNSGTDNGNGGANNTGNATNNGNNGIGDGIGGGGINNSGTDNGNSGANNTGNATDNGNNGIGDGIGGGGINNSGTGNGNGGANNTGNATDNGNNGIGGGVGVGVNNPGGNGIGVSVGGDVNNPGGNGNGNNGIGNGVGGGGVNNPGGNGNGNGGANNTGNNNRRNDD